MKLDKQFSEIYSLIVSARERAFHAVNTELIGLYWKIGEYISKRVDSSEWGKGIVENLAGYLNRQEPDLKGFSSRNLWRMKQFFETYNGYPNLSPLVTQLSWTNNLILLSRPKTPEEREFYLKLAIKENYSKRELERQINAFTYERSLKNSKLSPVVREIHPALKQHFRDTYVLDFLNLSEGHNEKDLQKAIIQNLKQFILEFGKDFAFVGNEYRIQVGNSDFFIDLLFYHRELQCLVAFELKIDKFQPEFLGKMNFYLEALDRDVKKDHENPSVGIILCKDKDHEVVEYALSRTLSPTMVAAYHTKLIEKSKLEAKLHELFENLPNRPDDEI
ncbi:MAG: DUF1016 domain-containing protein [Bacteroidia bacterium]|nr:DUF1016 domain-containing protein [Bacteroidia bacterium]